MVLAYCLELLSKKYASICYIVNLLLNLAKFHFHKTKYTHLKPNVFVFMKDFEHYANMIQFFNNSKAVKQPIFY